MKLYLKECWNFEGEFFTSISNIFSVEKEIALSITIYLSIYLSIYLIYNYITIYNI